MTTGKRIERGNFERRCKSCGFSESRHVLGKCLYGPGRYQSWTCANPHCYYNEGYFHMWHIICRTVDERWLHAACLSKMRLEYPGGYTREYE